MKRPLYIGYVVVVIILTLVLGQDKGSSRSWTSTSGGSGWIGGGGHK